jgi:hypothetical protein
VATIALMETIEIVMAVADREGGARILDSVADWLSNQLSDSPVPADVEICTFADMATMHPSEMADIGMVCFEIGRAGELDETRAAASAKALLTNVARYPRVQNMLSINGYDSDTRELWDIPEVKQFIAWMVASFSAAGRKLTELHLVPQSLTLLRACIGELVATSRDPITRSTP